MGPLEEMPNEVKERILGLLEKKNLGRVSRCNQHLHSLAVRVLYSEITIRESDLASDLAEWQALLERRDCANVVRHVRVVAPHDWLGIEGSDESDELTEVDSPWPVFVDWVRALPGLKHLTWDCLLGLPAALLQALTAQHQESRLTCAVHLTWFNMAWVLLCLSKIDESPGALLALPNIQSIAFGYDDQRPDRIDAIIAAQPEYTFAEAQPAPPDDTLAVVQRMTAGMASGLRVVQGTYGFRVPFCLLWAGAQELLESLDNQEKEKEKKKKKKGALRQLILTEEHETDTRRHLLDWAHHTDFDELRVLCLDAQVDMSAMAPILQEYSFPHLTHLSLNVNNALGPLDDFHLRQLLETVHPLTSLSLQGLVAATTLQAILPRHGRTLRTLTLLPRRRRPLSLSVIVSIASHCVFLEELTLVVRRPRDHAPQPPTYFALGTIARLQSLHLHIDQVLFFPLNSRANGQSTYTVVLDTNRDFIDNPDHWELEGEKEECEPRYYTSDAVDRSRAMEIFRAVYKGKYMVGQGQPRMLEEMTITPIAGTWDEGIAKACRAGGRHWRIKRSERDDERHVAYVEETNVGNFRKGEFDVWDEDHDFDVWDEDREG